MASVTQKRQSLFETIVDGFVPIHRDGLKFFMLALVVTALLFLLWTPLGWLGAIVSAYIAYFFRDPDRVTPLRDGLVVAPADGRISAIDKVKPPIEFGLGEEERTRISIFLSVFDVHVQRAPVAGIIKKSIYIPGAFFNAALDKASEENERRALVIETPYGASIAVVQIAGLIARRILTFVEEGQSIGMGQRYGLIRFGSRLDVYLPPGKPALVAIGQRAIAGESVLADLKSDEPERESVLN
ncbi:MAG: phosphatidylserine decarboxylase [Hyphomicrobiaceae bacterium]|jgi:phosphatidylserine decarboxylase|nr:MAG: phosphatidylserine decarboxylase [Hyphomicrobiaceae bacterium]